MRIRWALWLSGHDTRCVSRLDTPRAGDPMVLPPFAVAWLRASWDAHESALSTARKNAKSAIAAVVCLGYL